jgi:hypothetical protein
MTTHDWRLLKRAHEMKAIDHQLVHRMMPLADTKECKSLLKAHYHYLYAREEQMADVL